MSFRGPSAHCPCKYEFLNVCRQAQMVRESCYFRWPLDGEAASEKSVTSVVKMRGMRRASKGREGLHLTSPGKPL